MTTTTNSTSQEIVKMLNPSEVLVLSSNYIQCIINGMFCEFQISYTDKKWYEFKTTGRSESPKEKFVRWI